MPPASRKSPCLPAECARAAAACCPKRRAVARRPNDVSPCCSLPLKPFTTEAQRITKDTKEDKRGIRHRNTKAPGLDRVCAREFLPLFSFLCALCDSSCLCGEIP